METGDGSLSPLSESLKGVDFMKKLLSLLLAMILCLGVLVACDTPEESSSSSSEKQSSEESASSSIKGSTSFYYREYYSEVVNTAVKESIQFVTTYDEYLSIRNETALSYKFSRLSEAAFENSYVFYVVRMNLDVTRNTFMGYSDFEQIEDGYQIISSRLFKYTTETYSAEEGVVHPPEREVIGAPDPMKKVVYEMVVIPKKDVTFEVDASKPVTVQRIYYAAKTSE